MLPVKRADRTRLKDASKRHAPKQERAAAQALGGRTTKGSGNQSEKGDVRVKGVLRVEAKCTQRKSFSVTRETWDKIEDAASLCSPAEIPAMQVQFIEPDGTPGPILYIVRQDDFEEVLGKGKT